MATGWRSGSRCVHPSRSQADLGFFVARRGLGWARRSAAHACGFAAKRRQCSCGAVAAVPVDRARGLCRRLAAIRAGFAGAVRKPDLCAPERAEVWQGALTFDDAPNREQPWPFPCLAIWRGVCIFWPRRRRRRMSPPPIRPCWRASGSGFGAETGGDDGRRGRVCYGDCGGPDAGGDCFAAFNPRWRGAGRATTDAAGKAVLTRRRIARPRLRW